MQIDNRWRDEVEWEKKQRRGKEKKVNTREEVRMEVLKMRKFGKSLMEKE